MTKNLCKSGIVELDNYLGGGIPEGSVVLLSGGSGLGKTIFCMQWLFKGYKQFREPGVYITLTEPVKKAISNLEQFTFYDKSFISPLKIHMTDLRPIMEDMSLGKTGSLSSEDCDKLLDFIDNLIKQSRSRRLVIDSITAIGYLIKKKELIRSFIFRLGKLLSNLNCTSLLTSEVPSHREGLSIFGVEEFISDGIIKLMFRKRYNFLNRELEIVKMRGVNISTTPVVYKISNRGLNFYTLPLIEHGKYAPLKKIKTGIKGLDKMLYGGLFKNSVTLLSGPAGTGKSTFGLMFLLQGTTENKKGLLVTYEEPKSQIIRNARNFGFSLPQLEKKGLLHMAAIFPEDFSAEEQLFQIRRLILEYRPERMVLDSVSSLTKRFDKDTLLDFVKRLSHFVKTQQVTIILTNATSTLVGPIDLEGSKLSTVTDNIIMLKYVEIDSTVKRFIAAIKVRGSDHDKSLREFIISDKGIEIKGLFKGVQGMFSGSAQKNPEQNDMLKVQNKIVKAFEELSKKK